jgi:hypothetical protein
MNDCGRCKFCLDKRKFGGPGKLKKRCEYRVCMAPRRMGAASPGPAMSPMSMSPAPNKMPLEVKNKFLTTIENRQNIKIVENPPMPTENRMALENIIEMGLETYEVVNVNGGQVLTNGGRLMTNGGQMLTNGGQVVNVNVVAQPTPVLSGLRLCYICKRDNIKEDLFYCSACCDPFHQFCLSQSQQAQRASPPTTCGRCQGGKGDYEQAMNARAESINAKCEEIDGAQYQVISFLTDAEHLKMPEMILQVEDEEDEEVTAVANLPQPPPNPNDHYDNDFDSYLTTISLAE